MIKVLIADDHEMVRNGISKILKTDPQITVVGEADSGESVITRFAACNPDIILMDFKMPGIGGLEATRRILQRFPNAKVLVLTSEENDIFVSRFLELGVSGYLTKNANQAELLEAIHTVFSGKQHFDAAILTRIAYKGTKGTQKNEASPFERLSQREMQVALMILRGGDAKTIAGQQSLSPKTINSYRYDIFEKLGVKNDVQLTLLAVKHGLIDPNEVDDF